MKKGSLGKVCRLIEKLSCNPFVVISSNNIFAAIFSMILDKTDKFDIGRTFLKISGSSDSFLRKGLMRAVFNRDAKSPFASELVTILVIMGTSSGRNCQPKYK